MCIPAGQVSDVKIDRERRLLGLFPRVTFEDKGSYVESCTKQYDKMAFRWAAVPDAGSLSLVLLVPLLLLVFTE